MRCALGLKSKRGCVMHIREVRVGTGRTFNAPRPGFCVEKPTVEFTAVLSDGDDPLKVATELRRMAEEFAEDWKRHRQSQPEFQPQAAKRAKTEPKASKDPSWRQPIVPLAALAKPAKDAEGR